MAAPLGERGFELAGGLEGVVPAVEGGEELFFGLAERRDDAGSGVGSVPGRVHRAMSFTFGRDGPVRLGAVVPRRQALLFGTHILVHLSGRALMFVGPPTRQNSHAAWRALRKVRGGFCGLWAVST